MSVEQLEMAVSSLSTEEFAEFHRWFEEFAADAWDRKIEQDVLAGRLNHLVTEGDREFEAGRCTPV